MDKNSWLSSIFMALALVVVLGLASFIFFLISMSLYLEANNDTAFQAVWSLDELQENFIGPLPEDATVIEYEEGPLYALLAFQASPSSVDSFVRQFCYDMLYPGYDPFNSIDELLDDQGFLIKTHDTEFYFSTSPDTPLTLSGNRCHDDRRGGLQQISVDRSNPLSYTVRLEISMYCQNPAAKHPCNGRYLEYADKGEIDVDGDAIAIRPHYAAGEAWIADVEPGVRYEIRISALDAIATMIDHVAVSTIPLTHTPDEANTYCPECWLHTQGNITEGGFVGEFEGSPGGQTRIQLFWMTESETEYALSVTPK